MLKKVTTLAATLVLLLATAPLVLAQQDAGQHQSVQEAQVTTPDAVPQPAAG